MTVYRRRLVCLALALSLLLSLIPAGMGRDTAARAENKLGITLDKVNVRYGPSTGEKIMFSLPKDHVCIIREEKIKEDTIQIPVQVNGKVRATVEIGVDEEQAAVLEKAHAMHNVQVTIAGKTIVKEIYVKGRIVNIVVK